MPQNRRVVMGLLEMAVQGFLSNGYATLPEKLTFAQRLIQNGLEEEEEISHVLQSNASTIEDLQNAVQQRKHEIQTKYTTIDSSLESLTDIATCCWNLLCNFLDAS